MNRAGKSSAVVDKVEVRQFPKLPRIESQRQAVCLGSSFGRAALQFGGAQPDQGPPPGGGRRCSLTSTPDTASGKTPNPKYVLYRYMKRERLHSRSVTR